MTSPYSLAPSTPAAQKTSRSRGFKRQALSSRAVNQLYERHIQKAKWTLVADSDVSRIEVRYVPDIEALPFKFVDEESLSSDE